MTKYQEIYFFFNLKDFRVILIRMSIRVDYKTKNQII